MDGIYAVTLRAEDTRGADDTQHVIVTVQDTNDAPVITSHNGDTQVALQAQTHTPSLTIVAASDQDDHPLTYALIPCDNSRERQKNKTKRNADE